MSFFAGKALRTPQGPVDPTVTRRKKFFKNFSAFSAEDGGLPGHREPKPGQTRQDVTVLHEKVP